MSDLTNRLKGIYQIGEDSEFGTRDFSDFIPPISIEAAERIELIEGILEKSLLLHESWNLQQGDSETTNMINMIRDNLYR